MKLGAIITGDIVDSTKLTLEEREVMLSSLKAIPEVLNPLQTDLSIEIFRGDGFQIGVANVVSALTAAIVVRAWLKSIPLGKHILDARLAVGIGNINFSSDSLSTSDGEAFQLSGRLLDGMRKSRLEIETPWNSVNDELRLSTAFADDIISSWSRRQCETIIPSLLTTKSHSEIAQTMSVSRQMVDKALKAAKEDLITSYIKRYQKLITEHTIPQ